MKMASEFTKREKYPYKLFSNNHGNVVVNEQLIYEYLFWEIWGIYLGCGYKQVSSKSIHNIMNKIPNSFIWFSKLKLLKFIPWHIDDEIDLDLNSFINNRFRIESKGREVIKFASRQDQDHFAGFEILNGEITEKVLVFHPSFQTNIEGWNIVKKEYDDFFDFMKLEVLCDMKDWILANDVEEYIE